MPRIEYETVGSYMRYVAALSNIADLTDQLCEALEMLGVEHGSYGWVCNVEPASP